MLAEDMRRNQIKTFTCGQKKQRSEEENVEYTKGQKTLVPCQMGTLFPRVLATCFNVLEIAP